MPNQVPATAVIVLAHNEAGVIESTVASVLAVMERHDSLLVVADNCTDATADRAETAGARVLVRGSEFERGKGKALAWLVETYWEDLRRCAALVILDADSIVEPGFLRTVKDNLPDTTHAYQCFVDPRAAHPVGRLAALSELLDQLVSDRLRSRLGWPVRLRGAGMVVHPQALYEVRQRLGTEVEDIALSLLFTAGRVQISRLDEARLLDEKPGSDTAAARQRARWFRGQWQALAMYRWEAWQVFRQGPRGWSLLAALFLRPKWILYLASLLAGILLAGWPWLAAPFWLVVLAGFGYLVIGLARIPQRAAYIQALLYVPAFIWMWLRGILLAVRPSVWLRARD
ncbi:MAG: glycosyltransferase [Chloroflexi bacterium]|nr:glycosyltransferase [Chloroflexota bacterium]